MFFYGCVDRPKMGRQQVKIITRKLEAKLLIENERRKGSEKKEVTMY